VKEMCMDSRARNLTPRWVSITSASGEKR